MYRLVGASCGWGAQQKECELGPHTLYEKGLLQFLHAHHLSCRWNFLETQKKIHEGNLSFAQSLPILHSFYLELAQEVTSALEADEFPIVIGGDHSIAIGTWNGIYRYFSIKNNLPMGLIWIDAHMDAHTLQTTPSNAWHGMPLAALLGYGHPQLSQLLKKNSTIAPQNLALVGTRSFEPGEANLLKNLNVRIFDASEVQEKGMEQTMQEAILHVKKETQIFGVSCDLDVIDPGESPGVGSAEKNGVTTQELLQGLSLLREDSHFKAFELVEYNPKRDLNDKTLKICFEILLKVMKNEPTD